MKLTMLEILIYVNLAMAFMVILVISSTMYMQRRNNKEQEVED